MIENCQRLAPLPSPSVDIPDAPPVSQQHFPLEVERVEKTRAYVYTFTVLLKLYKLTYNAERLILLS